MFRNARRIGRRLERFLREYPDDPPAGWVLWAADYEQRFVFSALKEQRERAKLTPKNGAALLSDEEYEAALGDLVRASLDKMSEAELEQLLAERRKPKPIEVP
jgi:hypothetical protein